MERLNEPVNVVARFRDGKFEPTRFVWNGRMHKIAGVTGRWATSEGQYRVYHFSVVSDTDAYYEIEMNTRNMEWLLRGVDAG